MWQFGSLAWAWPGSSLRTGLGTADAQLQNPRGDGRPLWSTDRSSPPRGTVTPWKLLRLGTDEGADSGPAGVGALRGLRALKYDVFLRTLKDVGQVDTVKLVDVSFFTVEGGRPAAQRLWDASVTAIVCANDLMASVQSGLSNQAALRCPLTYPWWVMTTPRSFRSQTPLTTVGQPTQAMGVAAVRALPDEMRGVPIPHGHLLFPPRASGPRVHRPCAGTPSRRGPDNVIARSSSVVQRKQDLQGQYDLAV